MRTSLNHQPEVHHPKSPAIRWAADYPIFTPDRDQIAASRQLTKRANKRHRAASLNHLVGQRE
jgi:hypothetical protein